MNSDPPEILSAFVDGEPVDPAGLSEALARPGALEALVEFARLRAALSDDHSEPSPRFHAAIRKALASEAPARLIRPRSAAFAVAAMLLISLGVLFGWTLRPSGTPGRTGRPPEVTREVHFVTGVDWHSRS